MPETPICQSCKKAYPLAYGPEPDTTGEPACPKCGNAWMTPLGDACPCTETQPADTTGEAQPGDEREREMDDLWTEDYARATEAQLREQAEAYASGHWFWTNARRAAVEIAYRAGARATQQGDQESADATAEEIAGLLEMINGKNGQIEAQAEEIARLREALNWSLTHDMKSGCRCVRCRHARSAISPPGETPDR